MSTNTLSDWEQMVYVVTSFRAYGLTHHKLSNEYEKNFVFFSTLFPIFRNFFPRFYHPFFICSFPFISSLCCRLFNVIFHGCEQLIRFSYAFGILQAFLQDKSARGEKGSAQDQHRVVCEDQKCEHQRKQTNKLSRSIADDSARALFQSSN